MTIRLVFSEFSRFADFSNPNAMRRRIIELCSVTSLLLLGVMGCSEGGAPTPDGWQPAKSRKVTFARDVAPITYQHCLPCHRPGEGAPFDLITYDDVAGHATQIVEVVQSGYMPPWLPERGAMRWRSSGDFPTSRFRCLRTGLRLANLGARPATCPRDPS